MRNRTLMVSGIVVAMLAAAVFAADAIKLDGVKCVMAAKNAAKADKSVDYKGGKVFFCCDNCPKKFDAEKNSVAANHQLVATKQAKQAKCPLTGRDIDAEQKVTVDGAEVAFCCGNCKGKAEKATGEDQKKLLFSNAAFEKGGFKVAEKK